MSDPGLRDRTYPDPSLSLTEVSLDWMVNEKLELLVANSLYLFLVHTFCLLYQRRQHGKRLIVRLRALLANC